MSGWFRRYALTVTFVVSFVIAILSFGRVFAASSDTISFQSKLVNADGTNVPNGTYNYRFLIYSVSSGGTALWTEDRTVTVSAGVVSLQLGSQTSFPATLFDGGDLYLQVCLDGNGVVADSSDANCGSGTHRYEEVFGTRKPLASVPFAFRARALFDGLGNTYTYNSFFRQSGNAFGATGVLGTTDAYSLQFITNNVTRMSMLSNGNVGIGTTSPTAMFQVQAGGISGGSVTVSGTSGGTTLTFSEAITLYAGDYIFPSGFTSQAREIVTGGTGTTFTVSSAFSGSFTNRAYTISRKASVEGAMPILSLKNTSFTSQEYQFRVGAGVLAGTMFDIYDKTNGTVGMAIDSTGTFMVGANTNYGGGGNNSKMFVYGGAGGANIDVMGNPALRDQAVVELEGSDYATTPNSVSLEYYGPVSPSGTTLGYTNSKLGALSFNSTSTAIIRTNNTTPIIIGTNETARLTVGGDGNIGIGTTSPSYLLHVVKNGGTGGTVMAQFESNDTWGNGWYLNNTSAGGHNWLFYSYGSASGKVGAFGVYDLTANATRMLIDSTGNASFGGTTPGGKVEVVTTNDTSGIPTAFDNRYFTVGQGGSSGSGVYISYDQTNNRGYIGAVTPGTPTARNLILQPAGGNVGIGTMTPNTKMEIYDSSLYAVARIHGGDQGLIQLGHDNATSGSRNVNIESKSGYLSFATVNDAWSSVSAYSMRINLATGNMGIGNDTPGVLLALGNESTKQGYIRLYDGAGAGKDSNIYTEAGGGLRIDTYGNASQIRLDGSKTILGMTGNVGIGTTNPLQNLEVIGKVMLGSTVTNLTANNAYVLSKQYDSSTESEGWLMLGGNAASAANTMYIGGGDAAHNAATQVEFYTGANVSTRTGTKRFIIDSSGLATVGAAGGTAQFNVIGSANRIQTIVKGNATQTTNLMEWQNSSGSALASISGTGNWGVGVAPSATYKMDISGSIRSTGEVISTSANAFRMVSGNYGAILRNDGTNTSLLFTNSADQYGSYNSLLPLYVSNSTGQVTAGVGLDVTGNITGKQVYSVIQSGDTITAATWVQHMQHGNPGRWGFVVRYASPNLVFYNATLGDVVTVTSGGNFGIGVVPTYKLQVNGNSANTTGVWANYSDIRLKNNITPITNALGLVTQLQGVTFRWNDPQKDAQYGTVRGFIAQQVEQVIPEWIVTDSAGYKSIQPIGIDALLVEAIKTQQSEIESLQTAVTTLQNGTTMPFAGSARSFAIPVSNSVIESGMLVSGISIVGEYQQQTVHQVEKVTPANTQKYLGVYVGKENNVQATVLSPAEVVNRDEMEVYIEEGSGLSVSYGDMITVSSTEPGYGTKASTSTGVSVGWSMNNVDWSSVSEYTESGRKRAKVHVRINTLQFQQVASVSDGLWMQSGSVLTASSPIVVSGITATTAQFNVLHSRTLNINDVFMVDDLGNAVATTLKTSEVRSMGLGLNMSVSGSESITAEIMGVKALQIDKENVVINNLALSKKQAGSASLQAGSSSVQVSSPYAHTDSIVIVTVNGGAPIPVSVQSGEGSFVISTTATVTADTAINWVIFNTRDIN